MSPTHPASENTNINIQDEQLSAPSQQVDDHVNTTSGPCDRLSDKLSTGGVELVPCDEESGIAFYYVVSMADPAWGQMSSPPLLILMELVSYLLFIKMHS